MSKLFDEILDFALAKKLFYKNQKIGIAISGGSDSVLLFYFFEHIKKAFDLDLLLLHFNHKIRLDSDADEHFVESLAKYYSVELYKENKDVLKISQDNKKGLEEQARILRYDFFKRCKENFNLDKIAVAHTKNDLVETFLINLIRGSSLDGLSSLKPSRDFYIRPMLIIEKSQILNFLNENNLQYRTDTTNFDTKYKRNKVRLELIETLKTYNPNIISTLYKEIEMLSDDAALLNNLTYENFVESTVCFASKAIINLKILSSDYAIKSRVLKLAVKKITNSYYSLSFININRLINTIENGKTLVLRKLIKATKKENFLIIEKI
ncbi:tRNA lysidine(34) synthetase TilS [Desulfurella amilsii]|uniref:tRNA lysidine(34) synthetase TilS n=1 Tax=Desulfurella amilsii TaxID=1562698 RepID=UPI0013029D2B|nr:tRNA lysidine(34) synthetase TilS [Desulfurella amilsii]